MDVFILAFIPMFFAMDPIGLLPIYHGLTEHVSPSERRVILIQSLLTASILAFGFMIAGQYILTLLGISMGDFKVAGGMVLFCLAMLDLLSFGKMRPQEGGDLGVVPIGTPLIVGPAVLTMALISLNKYGHVLTGLSIAVNIMIVGVVFALSNHLMRWLGQSGAKAVSKVMALLLVAIGVMMIRSGISDMLR